MNLPLAWPGFLTAGLVVALGTWGEYQLALMFVHKPGLFPVTTSYSAYVSQFSRDWGRNLSPSSSMDFVFQYPWFAEDDTDIEYVYLHLI